VTDLSTTYMGLKLDNPVIVGSCGLTNSSDRVKKCADAGAAAVVLKSIFEEQIAFEVEKQIDSAAESMWHPDAARFIASYGGENSAGEYLRLIGDAKKAVNIPVIASIHCATAGKWDEFAARVEKEGADALELNIFVMPSDPNRDGAQNEQVYFDVTQSVKDRVSIPVSVKIGFFFSSLLSTLVKLSRTDISGMVLFNRFYCPDFDIRQLKLRPGRILSTSVEYTRTLRWIAILSGRTDCDIAAATGIHDGATAVKMLLAGANAVQVVSTLYKNKLGQIHTMLDEISTWMTEHDFSCIDDFKGKMAQNESDNPADYVRAQFMKHSVGIE